MSKTAVPQRSTSTLPSLDTITASLVARQSRKRDGSLSVEDQIVRMREWCASQTPPVAIGAIYEERDVSGRRPLDKRRGLKAAVEDVEAGRSQIVLGAYFDRLVRSVATRADVVQRVERVKGARVVSIDFGQTSDATAIEWLSGTLLAAISEFVARQIGEKTVDAIQRSIDEGRPPYASVTAAYQRRPDGTLEQHPHNAPLIREACEMRTSGVSYSKIAKWLNEHELTTFDDDGNVVPFTITREAVVTTLASKLLVGEIHFGTFRPNLHACEPIIDHETFQRMHRTKSSRGRYSKSERLLARQSVLFCKSCDSRLTLSSAKRGDRRYQYYACRNDFCDAHASISADAIDDLVAKKAIELSAGIKGRASAKSELEAARVAADEAKRTYTSAIRTLAGHGDESATAEVLDELRTASEAASAEHRRLELLTSPDRTVTTRRDWDKLSLDGKRGVVRATIARVVIAPSSGSRKRVPRDFVDPARIAIETRTK